MPNVLYEVAYVNYDEYIFLGLYSSLQGALDCFFKKQDKNDLMKTFFPELTKKTSELKDFGV